MNYKEKAVGYSRVSTNLQAERDDSLERQAARIRQAAHDNGWDLLGVYRDVASATGKDSLVRRPGLRDALAHAERDDAFIAVAEPTRLFRNRQYGLKVLREGGAKVYSLKNQGMLSRKKLGEAFQAGEDQAEVTREATSKAMAKAARSSRPSRKASENSSFSRKYRSEEIAEEIADVLEQDPSLDKLKHRDFAEMLNSRGLRSGWGRKWNSESVRNRRARAKEILRGRSDADDANDEFATMSASSTRTASAPQSPVIDALMGSNTKTSVRLDRNTRDDNAPEENLKVERELQNNPLFGLF